MTKRQRIFNESVNKEETHSLEDGLTLLKEVNSKTQTKFSESVEIDIRLGIDAKKSDQIVRGVVVMPHGIGKDVKVAVFAEGNDASAAKEAGADIVGWDDLVNQVKNGDINFDVAIATPDAMKIVGTLGQVLGPRGLMPNPKFGTVTKNVADAVKLNKAGQVKYRVDGVGVVRCQVGKINFDVAKLIDNIRALMANIKKAKPSTAKGVYLKKVCISSTMGPGILIDISSI